MRKLALLATPALLLILVLSRCGMPQPPAVVTSSLPTISHEPTATQPVYPTYTPRAQVQYTPAPLSQAKPTEWPTPTPRRKPSDHAFTLEPLPTRRPPLSVHPTNPKTNSPEPSPKELQLSDDCTIEGLYFEGEINNAHRIQINLDHDIYPETDEPLLKQKGRDLADALSGTVIFTDYPERHHIIQTQCLSTDPAQRADQYRKLVRLAMSQEHVNSGFPVTAASR